MTYRQVIYDLYTSLRQNYDDSKLTLTHIQYWVSIVANRLLMQHIDKRESGAFLTSYTDIPILKDAVTKRKYIELPEQIIDFNKDGGIEYLSYGFCMEDCVAPFTAVQFTRTSPSDSRRLYYTSEEKPTSSNPYFYREGNRLYLLGVECVDVCGVEIGIYQIVDALNCDLDDDIPLPNELITVLQKYILDLGRWVLSVPENYINDGNGEIEINDMPKSKLLSVNNDSIGQQAQLQAQLQAQQNNQQE